MMSRTPNLAASSRNVYTGASCLALIVAAGLEIAGAVAVPTFNTDVAPIMFAKCAGCHRAGQMAPMSLLAYGDARPWAQSIKRQVVAREMPPWRADPRFGAFRNDRSLSQSEIDTIVAWVDGGAQQGTDPPPPVPHFAEGWSHPSGRPPDVVMEMPITFDVPAAGQLPPFAVYSELPKELTVGDRFVEAVQLVPSNPKAVHHSTFSMRALPAGVRLGSGPAWPGGPVLSHIPLLADRSPAGLSSRRTASAAELFSTAGTSHFLFYFPGNNGFAEFAPAAGKRIRSEDYVEWSVHYTPTGQPGTDRERVGLWLQRVPPTHEVVTMRIGDFHIVNGKETLLPAGVATTPGHAAIVNLAGRCAGVPCFEERSMIPPIPPRAENWTITGITPFQDDVTVYLAYPHGHLRLAAMTYVVTYPDGREETILSVPRFDFNWQDVYEWAQPLHIPAGSTIKAVGRYDNSPNNRSNPSPDSEVSWGEQTTDEMFNGYIDMSIDKMDVRLEETATAGRRDLATPAVPLAVVVGCVSRNVDGSWILTRASLPNTSAVLHADEQELAEARRTLPGVGHYKLVGTADFGPVDALMAKGQRALFTQPATANSTNSLVQGHRVAVKGLLIPTAPRATLNLVSVQSLADSCK